MKTLSQEMDELIERTVTENETKLREIREWIDKMKMAGFTVSDLESAYDKAKRTNERLRDIR